MFLWATILIAGGLVQAPLQKQQCANSHEPVPYAYYESVLKAALRPPERQKEAINISIHPSNGEWVVVVRSLGRHKFEVLRGAPEQSVDTYLTEMKEGCQLPPNPSDAPLPPVHWDKRGIREAEFFRLHEQFLAGVRTEITEIQHDYRRRLAGSINVYVHIPEYIAVYDDRQRKLEIRIIGDKTTLPRNKLFAWALSVFQATAHESVTGIIRNGEGKPLAGIYVYSSPQCCPMRAAHALTDAAGRYKLKNPGAVIYIRDPRFQPITRLTLQPHQDFALRLPETFLQIPTCAADSTTRDLGGVVRFTLPADVKVPADTGKEFSAYSIPSESGDSDLRISLGPLAGYMDPAEHSYRKFVSFRERFVVDEHGKVIGMDTRGVTPDGKRWRWVGFDPSLGGVWPVFHDTEIYIVTPGLAGYENATEQDSKFFDQIVDNACIPLTRRTQ